MSEELQTLFEAGKPQEVLDKFTQKEVQGEWVALPEEEQIECIYYKSRSLEWLGRYEEALQTATMARTTYPSPKNPSFLLALLAAQFYVLFALRHLLFDKAQSVLTEGETIIGALTDKERQAGAFWIAVFEHVKGVDYWVKRELNLSLEYRHKALKLFEALDNRHGIAQCLHGLGENYYFKDELDTALKYFQRSLTLYESLGNKQGIGFFLPRLSLSVDLAIVYALFYSDKEVHY